MQQTIDRLERSSDDVSLIDVLEDDRVSSAYRDPRVNYSQDAPAKTHRAVPEAAKGYEHPVDINLFIELMIPNMQLYVGAKIASNTDGDSRDNIIDEIVNNFVSYMLGEAPTRDNRLRWTLYDNKEFKLMPYYKWWLRQLDFFRRDYQRKYFKDRAMFTLSEGDYEDTFETAANKAINIETLDLAETSVDVVEEMALAQIYQSLQAYSARHSDPRSFEANAYKLFVWKMEEETTKEIASRLSISVSAVGQWSNKLKVIVADLMGEGAPRSMAPAR